MWQLAPCLVTLRAQLDLAWPGRDRTSDGTIGDPKHQLSGAPRVNAAGYGVAGSDHNPDGHGYVCAFDIDADIAPGVTAHDIAVAIARSADPRIGYLISQRQIYSNRGGASPWAWRPYTGDNPHDHHAHVSCNHLARYRDSSVSWDIGLAPPNTVPPVEDDLMLILTADGKSWLLSGGRARPIANGNDYSALRAAGIAEAKVSRATIDAWT